MRYLATLAWGSKKSRDIRMLTVVYSEHDLGGKGHTGSNGNAPEERKRLVQKALRDTGRCEFVKLDHPESSLDSLGRLAHDPGLLTFLNNAWEQWTRIWNKRPNDYLKGIFCGENVDLSSTTPPPLITGYFAPRESAQSPSPGIFGQISFYSMDRETPIHSSTVSSLKWDLAVTRQASKLVVTGATRVAYAQITHPGHHAFHRYFGGFCFINHAAVAARLLQQKFTRVAVIDVDYHAGNGTMSIFWDDPNVFVASLHADPTFEYPFNSGYTNQDGGDKVKGTKLNIPLPGGTTWEQYKIELKKVVDKVKQFKAQALVVSLGVDTLHDDPVALPNSRFKLEPKDYKEMGQMLLRTDLALPTVVIQEGGYKLDEVSSAISAFLTDSFLPTQSFL